MMLDWAKVIWCRAEELWTIYVQMFPAWGRGGLRPWTGVPGLVPSFSVRPRPTIGEAVSQNKLCALRTVARGGRVSR